MHQISIWVSSPEGFYQCPCMMKKQSLSLLLINAFSKLETSIESTSVYNSSKGSIRSASFIFLGDIAKFNALLSKDFSVVLRT